MKKIEIRPAEAEDLAAVAVLERAWEAEAITYGYVEEKEADLAVYLGDYFLVAEQSGEVVGFVFGEMKAENASAVNAHGTYLEINDLYVKKEHRQKGTGAMLLAALEDAARRKGVRQLQLYSAVKDIQKTINFYSKAGFKSWYIRMFKDI